MAFTLSLLRGGVLIHDFKEGPRSKVSPRLLAEKVAAKEMLSGETRRVSHHDLGSVPVFRTSLEMDKLLPLPWMNPEKVLCSGSVFQIKTRTK